MRHRVVRCLPVTQITRHVAARRRPVRARRRSRSRELASLRVDSSPGAVVARPLPRRVRAHATSRSRHDRARPAARSRCCDAVIREQRRGAAGAVELAGLLRGPGRVTAAAERRTLRARRAGLATRRAVTARPARRATTTASPVTHRRRRRVRLARLPRRIDAPSRAVDQLSHAGVVDRRRLRERWPASHAGRRIRASSRDVALIADGLARVDLGDARLRLNVGRTARLPRTRRAVRRCGMTAASSHGSTVAWPERQGGGRATTAAARRAAVRRAGRRAPRSAAGRGLARGLRCTDAARPARSRAGPIAGIASRRPLLR